MTRPDDLVDAIAAAGSQLLRSSVPTAAKPTTDGRLSLAAGLDLQHGRWVCVVADEADRRWTVPIVLERSSARRARVGDGVAEALVDRIVGLRPVESPFAVQSFAGRRVAGERVMGVDQTNESVVVGEAAVVKWCLQLPAREPSRRTAVAPAARRLTALAAAGFDGMPDVWGLLRLDVGDDEPLLLASVTGYLPGAVDGWEWATADARAFAAGELDQATSVAPASALGELTAQMHLAFAAAGRERATPVDAQRWAEAAHRDLTEAVERIDGSEGARLAASASQVAAELAVFGGLDGTPLIDIHGDLHVGQALRHSMPPAYVITDFDGSPVASLDESARRQPAAVDVAGMIASLDHVGRVVLHRTPGVARARVVDWIERVQEAYLSSYRRVLTGAGAEDLLDDRLLRPLRFRQECREFLYAAQHLPHWRYVPDQTLAALIGSGP
jgi:maltokinase